MFDVNVAAAPTAAHRLLESAASAKPAFGLKPKIASPCSSVYTTTRSGPVGVANGSPNAPRHAFTPPRELKTIRSQLWYRPPGTKKPAKSLPVEGPSIPDAVG